MKAKPQTLPAEEQAATPEEREPLLRRWWGATLGNSRRGGIVAAVVFAVFLGWHVVTGRNGLNSWQRKSAEEKALALEIQQLAEENAHLRRHVERLRSDPAAIEDEARKRLHYARPNEIIYALPEQPRPVSPAPSAK